MDGNLRMLANNFVLVVHISGGEVDENIDDEHDVDYNEADIIQNTLAVFTQPNKSIITMGSDP